MSKQRCPTVIGMAVIGSISQNNLRLILSDGLNDGYLIGFVVLKEPVCQIEVFPGGDPEKTGRVGRLLFPNLWSTAGPQFTFCKVHNTNLMAQRNLFKDDSGAA